MKEHILTLGNTKILAGLDLAHKRVHMLDLNNKFSLTNALGKIFCQFVLDQVNNGPKEPIGYYEVICYHTDSTMTQFDPDKEDFQLLSPKDERVNVNFKKEMFYLYGAM